MDGDLAPLVDLVELAERHDCMLMVDEAHATGVLRGWSRHCRTFRPGAKNTNPHGHTQQSAGRRGGFVAGSRQLIDWLWNRARPFVFSTAHPPAVAAAAIAAIDIVQSDPHRRFDLLANAAELREAFAAPLPSAAGGTGANHSARDRFCRNGNASGRRAAPPRIFRSRNPTAVSSGRPVAAAH